MLQMRPKDGDKRWYDADRDLVYAVPRIIRTVLDTFEASAANLEYAKSLGAIFVHCRQCDVSVEDARKMVDALKKAYPDQYAQTVDAVFRVLVGEVRWGCGAVSPKTADDAVVNLFGLDDIGPAMLARRPWWRIWR